MQETIDVNTGEVVVCGQSGTLRAIAMGSCISVATYDTKVKVAGIAHIMLPGNAPKSRPNDTRYAKDGINKLLDQLIESGSVCANIEVCLVGAGNVLKKEDDTICESNIASVILILSEKGIPIRASILGGYERKSVFLDAETGRVSYTQGDGSKTLLWQPKRAVEIE